MSGPPADYPPELPPEVARWLAIAAETEAARAFRAQYALRYPRPRYEPGCTGVDPSFQTIGSSPYGDQTWVGLQWPLAPWSAPTELNPLGVGNYLAVLDSFYVPANTRKRLRGFRQLRMLMAITNPAAPSGMLSQLREAAVMGARGDRMAALGPLVDQIRARMDLRHLHGPVEEAVRALADIAAPAARDRIIFAAAAPAPRPTWFEVTTPGFHFPDSFLSWHLCTLDDSLLQAIRTAAGPFDTSNFAFRMSNVNAAILYENAGFAPADLNFQGKPDYYQLAKGYVPPNGGGRPWGKPLGSWGTFYDLRTPWRNSQAWQALDMEIEGPRTVAIFAACHQTNPATRQAITLPSGPGLPISSGIAPEEAFAVNWPLAIEGSVAAQLVVEESV